MAPGGRLPAGVRNVQGNREGARVILIIGKKSYAVASFAEASARYQQVRGTKPSSRMQRGMVRDDTGRRSRGPRTAAAC